MTFSIRARLTFWYTAVLSIVLFSFGISVMWVQQRFGRWQLDDDLAAMNATTESVLKTHLADGADLARAAADTRRSINVGGRAMAIFDADGAPLAAHWRGLQPSSLPALSAAPEFFNVADGANIWRVHVRKSGPPAMRYYVVSAAGTGQIAHEQKLLARALLVAMPFALLFAAGFCWWAASRALQPVTEMAADMESITARSPDGRLRSRSSGDELEQLTRSFNQLLDRLSSALRTQRRFMADASHELRTPISIARTAAEVTLSREGRGEPEYRDALGVVGEQVDRLGRIVEDMLVLARVDGGGYPVRFAPVCAADLVADTVHAMDTLAARHGVQLQLSVETDGSGVGDAALLRQLVTNLIDNAIKHTPAGGAIDVVVRGAGTDVEIAVSDTGCGVPPADRERIFERFIRLDPARGASSGAGLGLPIARWIAGLHGGTLVAGASESGGALFTARLHLGAEAVARRGEGRRRLTPPAA
jgi:heavy metal sensor kinase